jgi:TRAP-type mannitol/chloroaromatic compound transport system permease large subunit
MKGVSPPSVTMQHIIRGAIPFLIIDIIAVVVIVIIPKIVTVLPSLI